MEERTVEFRLVPVDSFDARRGYSRWILPGVGIYFGRARSGAVADLWVDRQGHLFTRFTSQGYTLHYRVKPCLCDKILPEMDDNIEEFLRNMLFEWVTQGVDDDLECDSVEYEDTDE